MVKKTIEIQKLKETISKIIVEKEKIGEHISDVTKLRMDLLVFKKY